MPPLYDADPVSNDTSDLSLSPAEDYCEFDFSSDHGDAPISGLAPMNTNADQDDTALESKDQVQSLINPDGSDMRRMSDNIDRDLITIPQHTSSDGNAPTPEIPRRSGRLKSKHVTTPNPRNYKPIKLKPSKPSSKKQKPAASPANDESVQPVILRLASIPEPSQLTDKLFDSSVEELWRVHGELCYERAILERRIWALGEDINKLAEVISHREKRAPTPVRGSKWGV